MSEKYATFPELKPVSPAPEQSASQTGEGGESTVHSEDHSNLLMNCCLFFYRRRRTGRQFTADR